MDVSHKQEALSALPASTPASGALVVGALTPILLVLYLALTGFGALGALPAEALSACPVFQDASGACDDFAAAFALRAPPAGGGPGEGAPPPALTWLAMAGAGGSDRADWAFSTPAQDGVARQMGRAAAALGARFALALGGNFWPRGVASSRDARFAQTFERVFSAPALHRPAFFRLVAGESDYHANVSALREYGSREPDLPLAPAAPRWYYPRSYYTFVEAVPLGELDARIASILARASPHSARNGGNGGNGGNGSEAAVPNASAAPAARAPRRLVAERRAERSSGARAPPAEPVRVASAGDDEGGGAGEGAGVGTSVTGYAELRAVTVQFVMLDTTMLVGCALDDADSDGEADTSADDRTDSARSGSGSGSGSGSASGAGPEAETAAEAAAAAPSGALRCPARAPGGAALAPAYSGALDAARADAQWAWVRSTLLRSTADFLIVGGHHAVWASCALGPTAALVARLAPLLEQAAATAYVSGGRDGCAQLLDVGGVAHVGVGGARALGGGRAFDSALPAGAEILWDSEPNARGREIAPPLNPRHGAFALMRVSGGALVETTAHGTPAPPSPPPRAPARSARAGVASGGGESDGGSDGAAGHAVPDAFAPRSALSIAWVAHDGTLLHTAAPRPPRPPSALRAAARFAAAESRAGSLAGPPATRGARPTPARAPADDDGGSGARAVSPTDGGDGGGGALGAMLGAARQGDRADGGGPAVGASARDAAAALDRLLASERRDAARATGRAAALSGVPM